MKKFQAYGLDIEISEHEGLLVVDIATDNIEEHLQWDNGVPKLRIRINEDVQQLNRRGDWEKERDLLDGEET